MNKIHKTWWIHHFSSNTFTMFEILGVPTDFWNAARYCKIFTKFCDRPFLYANNLNLCALIKKRTVFVSGFSLKKNPMLLLVIMQLITFIFEILVFNSRVNKKNTLIFTFHSVQHVLNCIGQLTVFLTLTFIVVFGQFWQKPLRIHKNLPTTFNYVFLTCLPHLNKTVPPLKLRLVYLVTEQTFPEFEMAFNFLQPYSIKINRWEFWTATDFDKFLVLIFYK